MKLAVLILCGVACCAAGCGGNSSKGSAGGGSSAPVYPAVAGDWYFRATDTDAGVYLSQSGGTVTGTAHINSRCFQQNNDIVLSGTVDTSGNLSLTSSPNPNNSPSDAQLQVRGLVTSGSLANPVVVASCVQDAVPTAMAGNQMPPFTGTYAGDLISNAGNPPVHIVISVAQGTAVNQGGYLPVTGTTTLRGTSCVALQGTAVPGAGAIASMVIGPFASVTFSNGVWLEGMLSADASQFMVQVWSIDGGTCHDGGEGTLVPQV